MKGSSSPQGTGAWRFLAICSAWALLLTVFLVVLGSDLPSGTRQLVSDVGLLGGGIAGAATCSYRGRRFTGRRRRAWMLFAAAGGFTALGNVAILGVHLSSAPPSSTIYSAPAFVLALLCGILGLGLFSASPRRGTDLARMVFDGVIISGSVFLLSVSAFPEIVATKADTSSLGVLLPLTDVAMATFAILIFLRVDRTDRMILSFLSGGLALYAISDFIFIVLTATHSDFGYGTPVDVGWMAGYALIGVAALHPAAAAAPSSEPSKELSPIAGTIVMFCLVGLAVGWSITHDGEVVPSITLNYLWLFIVLAVAARQLLLIVDNDQLRHGLEVRVADRTVELQQAIRRSDLLLSSVGEGIYGVDRDGLITFVNPAGANALGHTAQDLIGREAHSAFHAKQEDGTPFPLTDCYVTQAIRDETVTNAEEDVYYRADGRRFAVEVTATPLTSDALVKGAVVVFRDITQRLEVDRLKSEFVSMVSHELRTPLTSIRGSLGLLAGGALGPLPGKAVRLVNLALDSCARLTRLINDILDIERIESGTMPMELGNHRADTLIEAATAQLNVLAAQADVTLIVTKADGIVHADADRVVQTLINLVDNAIKFSPAGGTVEVASFARGAFVEFRISDEGRGIPAEKLDSIFRRFEQVDSSDARDKGGSGLGLAISRSVVDRLGGRIWAESIQGFGAAFHFTLPRSASDTTYSSAPGSNESQTANDRQLALARAASGLT